MNSLLDILRLVISLAVLIYAGYRDLLYRDISVYVWIIGIPLLIAIDVYDVVQGGFNSFIKVFSFTMSFVILCIVLYFTFVVKQFGGADAFAIATIVFALPYPITPLLVERTPILPPVIAIFAYYTMMILGLVIYNITRNLRYLSILRAITVPRKFKIVWFLTAVIMSVREFKKRKFYFPLYIPGKLTRLSFSIDEEWREWKRKLETLDEDTMIIASWGIPTVTLLTTATFIYIFLGDPLPS